eukprot:snap_masked-scaffold_20-processed-gene-5.99-mRNA-1 protein AED:1.00 eAED:1.00 QI:0/0/0/0/1/1/2/0/394
MNIFSLSWAFFLFLCTTSQEDAALLPGKYDFRALSLDGLNKASIYTNGSYTQVLSVFLEGDLSSRRFRVRTHTENEFYYIAHKQTGSTFLASAVSKEENGDSFYIQQVSTLEHSYILFNDALGCAISQMSGNNGLLSLCTARVLSFLISPETHKVHVPCPKFVLGKVTHFLDDKVCSSCKDGYSLESNCTLCELDRYGFSCMEKTEANSISKKEEVQFSVPIGGKYHEHNQESDFKKKVSDLCGRIKDLVTSHYIGSLITLCAVSVVIFASFFFIGRIRYKRRRKEHIRNSSGYFSRASGSRCGCPSRKRKTVNFDLTPRPQRKNYELAPPDSPTGGSKLIPALKSRSGIKVQEDSLSSNDDLDSCDMELDREIKLTRTCLKQYESLDSDQTNV